MIVRRAEYKRRRKYKARARKRNPMDRVLKRLVRGIYADFRLAMFPMTTPILANIRRSGSYSLDWGGNGAYNLNV